MRNTVIGLAACAVCATGAWGGGPTTIGSPFIQIGPGDGVIGARLALDLDVYEQLKTLDAVTVQGFVLDADHSVTLELQRFSVWSPDVEFVVNDEDGPHESDAPDLVLLKGRVAGVKGDSAVYLALSPFGANGYILLDDHTYVVSSGPATEGLDTVVYDLTALPDGKIIWNQFVCGAMDLAENQNRVPWVHGDQTERSETTCRHIDLAIDSDWEYTNDLFGGNTASSQAYIGTLLGAVAEIYDRDLAMELTVGYTRVWSSNTDPYVSNNIFDAFQEFQGEWRTTLIGQPRDLAHLLSARSYSGAAGVAYIGGLCTDTLGYGLSGYLNGFFPYPLIDNNSQNWDVVVVAHEVGHNHGTGHTHDDYQPPIDGCGNGDCTLAPFGTIMSYCHTCPGGMTNIRLGFHPLVINRMDHYMRYDAACDDMIPIDAQITQQPVSQQACIGLPASFSVEHSGPGQFTYKWRHNGAVIPGATSLTLDIPAVQPSDAGDYVCEVDSGCETVLSDAAVLDVCGTDCNGNGLDDALDIGVTSTDCNANLLPDECDVVPQPYADASGDYSPLGFGNAITHVFAGTPEATTDVTLDFHARGDLSDPAERISVLINGSLVGFAFETTGSDCPAVDDTDTIVVPAATWNTARNASGDVSVNMSPNSSVTEGQCLSGSYIGVAVSYDAVPVSQDANANSTPDECEGGCGPADTTTTGAASGDPGYGEPDGSVTAGDLNYFVNGWVASDAAIADLTTTGAGAGDPGYGVPDGNVTAGDLNYYVNLWVAGCP